MHRLAAGLWVIAGLAFSATPAAASEWRYLTSGASGTDVYVDVASLRELPPVNIRRPFPVRQIWVEYVTKGSGENKATFSRVLQRFDCQNEQSMAISVVDYSPSGEAKTTQHNDDYDFNYRPEIPDTIGYAILEFICGRGSIPEGSR